MKGGVKCSFYGCGKSFIRKNFSLDTKSPHIDDEDKLEINDQYKLEIIIDCMLLTKLFCLNCSINHAISICQNSKIRIER